ncbi:DUF2807 domain-containing protein [Mucilaginibacter mali]|uniref:DUF2807 domain-containing protein n=1 Tax=Mucilaginibacter mali TaxID=2740462 RepID=A0A7D4Q356_9SPHI|nr:head GIN domain-containing protein [Mucilaginibacter mali]QKJ31966.1 DUF2807 domain-containing protein [Mucilaginibacter mali]
MKTLTKILFTALLLAGFNSAFADTEDRHLSGFHAISVMGSFDVYVTQGPSESVKVEAPADVMSKIITEVKGDVLKVRNKDDNFNWRNLFSSNNHKKIVIYVTVKEVHDISLSGSGDVFFKEGINAPKLSLSISGSGDVLGKVNVKSLESSISGSGDIKLSGNAETSTISTNGSGDFSGRDLVTVNTMVRISGSGDASVNASQKVDARVSGSGDIRYTGGATQVSSHTSGSGSVHKF